MSLRDYLNYPTREELRTYVLAHGQAVAILGETVLGDIPQETWYYDENSLAVDNGLTVMKPDELLDTEPGRFLINMVQADYTNLFNKPDFAEVAMSGDYNDLSNKLTTGMGLTMEANEISVDDNEVMTVDAATAAIATMEGEIETKAPLSRTITINGVTQDLTANRSYEVGNVSTTGTYSNPTWITALAASKITGLATVATTGSYNSLSNTPTIPAAQVNSDWNSSTGLSQILNKPTIPTNTNQLTNGAGFITSVPAQSWTSITGKPTNLSGYGITDAYPLTGNPSNFLTTVTSGQITSALGYTPYNGATNPNSYITQAGARSVISLTTTGSGAATYSSSTGVLNIPTPSVSAPTFNPAPARTLNTNYTISTTQNARVSYTIALTTTLSLLNLNSAARVYLEYSTNAGSTWNTINSAGTSRTLAVSISVGLNETTYWNLVGEVPANALVRLRSVVSGGGTAAWDSGIEVTY